MYLTTKRKEKVAAFPYFRQCVLVVQFLLAELKRWQSSPRIEYGESVPKQIDNALASVCLEGLEPSDGAKTTFQRYVEGVLTSEEMGRTTASSNDFAKTEILTSACSPTSAASMTSCNCF
jgi:Antitoxin VbhA